MATKKRPPTKTQSRLRDARAEASLARALKFTTNSVYWNRAMLSAAKAIYPGKQNEKQAHAAHLQIRGAIVRYLTRGDVRR